MNGQIALVTGASRGIGAATAIELARRGAHVVLAARTQGGLEETDDAIRAIGGSATLLPLDLLDGEAIDKLGPSLHARFGRLDILLGNAATLGLLTPVAHIQEHHWADTIAINMTANWRLIRTCAPLLTASPAGRAVFMTTRVAVAPRAFWGLYGATKAGMEHLVQVWAAETRTTALRVNLFDPGVVDTRMRQAAMPGEDRSKNAKPEDVAPLIADLLGPDETRHGEVVRRARVVADAPQHVGTVS